MQRPFIVKLELDASATTKKWLINSWHKLAYRSRVGVGACRHQRRQRVHKVLYAIKEEVKIRTLSSKGVLLQRRLGDKDS